MAMVFVIKLRVHASAIKGMKVLTARTKSVQCAALAMGGVMQKMEYAFAKASSGEWVVRRNGALQSPESHVLEMDAAVIQEPASVSLAMRGKTVLRRFVLIAAVGMASVIS